VAEIDLTIVMVFLGHKNKKMTLRTTHVALEHKRKAATVFNFFLKNNLPPHTTGKQ